MAWDVTVKENATIEDTLTLIVQAVNQCSQSEFVKELAGKLAPYTLAETNLPQILSGLFDFVKTNVKYVNDGKDERGVQIERVFTPERTIREGEGDCKKMTVLIASVLKAAGIEPILKHVIYGPAEKWTHIYTIVSMVPGFPSERNQYYVIDPTIPGGQFNEEVDYSSGLMMNLNGQTSKPMDLHMMGKAYRKHDGMPFSADIAHCHHNIEMAGESLLGARRHFNIRDLKSRVHNLVQHHLQQNPNMHPHHAVNLALHHNDPHGLAIANKILHIPIEQQRGAVLTLIKKNYNGIAHDFLKALGTDPKALDNIWHIVGGDINTLKRAVLEGSKVPAAHGEETGSATLIGKGFFKKLLHGAASILHAVAPIVNAIIPGAGVAINNVANKAENLANDLPNKDAKTGQLLPPPPHADIPIDHNGVPFGHAGVMGHGATTLLALSSLTGILERHLNISHFVASSIILFIFLFIVDRFGYCGTGKGFIKKFLNSLRVRANSRHAMQLLKNTNHGRI